MPFPRAFYRAVVNLSRPRPQADTEAPVQVESELADHLSAAPPPLKARAAQAVEIDLADLDFDRPEQALEALRRVVAESGKGEQLVLLRTDSAKKPKSYRRRAKTAPESEIGV